MVTVSAEYCAFLEKAESTDRDRFTGVLTKLLPLIYLKASMLPEVDPDDDIELSEWVTEGHYDALRQSVSAIMGEEDDYLEVFVEDMKYSDTPVRKEISEDLADIYQALKNFVESYKSADNAIMGQAAAMCRDGFCSYWGQTLTNTLRALHAVRYRQTDWIGE